MFLKKTEYRVSNFNKTNSQIHSFAENASKKNLVLSNKPNQAVLSTNQFFLKGVIGRLSVKF